MRILIIAISILTLCVGIQSLYSSNAQQSEYQKMKTEAEKYYREGSYARAYELYSRMTSDELSLQEKRWLKVRTADAQWRSISSSETADTSLYDQAHSALTEVYNEQIEHDDVWVAACESLADFWWMRRDSHNWAQGWQYYWRALDYWAGSRDLDTAREYYIGIIRRMTEPHWREAHYYYGYYGNWIDLQVLRNYQQIALKPEDRVHANYLLARTLQNYSYNIDDRDELIRNFEAVLAYGKAMEWYDDALFNYAVWHESYGKLVPLEGGNFRLEPDFKRAVELYDRFLSEFKEGESRFYSQALKRKKQILEPSLDVNVSSIFLPDSEIEYNLSWRNVEKIDLAIYRIDLMRDLVFSDAVKEDVYSWVQRISVAGREKVRAWSKSDPKVAEHLPGSETARLDGKLPPGAYILEAVVAGSSKIRSQDLILVTDASIVLKQTTKRSLIYLCNALTGAPMPGVVKIWQRTYDTKTGRWYWKQSGADTGSDGIAITEIASSDRNTELLYLATSGDRQAFALLNSYYAGKTASQSWRVYAYTDRPAYRPAEKVQWKFTARTYNGAVYDTPAGAELLAEFYDPQGNRVGQQQVKLNGFGSAWGELLLTETMPLGEYRIRLFSLPQRYSIGDATLFRLEEYKLPEFKVSVQTPEEDGRRKVFRLGEKVEVSIQADYYFGGPVANADVEVVVYQRPFYHYWHPARDYEWYYESKVVPDYYGGGSVLKREKLKTDATGRAKLVIETQHGGQGYDYKVEARVVDASRREITASSSIRVANQRYFVYLHPKSYLYRPQEKVETSIKAIDANDQPVEVEGTVHISRNSWQEIWIDPLGREVTGDELHKLQTGVFPPPPLPDGRRWRLKQRGYKQEEILKTTVKTDREGKAEVVFTPPREGYYRIAWSSPDKNAPYVKAETAVWVVTTKSSDIGYRNGRFELITDRDTFRVGQTAPVMLVAPTNGRYVLFSIEGEDLYSYQLVQMTGDVKLVEVKVEQQHTPNIFVSGSMVTYAQIYSDTKEIVVPPTKSFLNVEVKADRDQYRPREEGRLSITTTDDEGRPVSAEVSLGLVDESIFYIQQDYAGDPRKFFYGSKRANYVQTVDSFQNRGYVKLLPPKPQPPTDDTIGVADGNTEGGYRQQAVVNGVVGGVAESAAVPPPPSPPAPQEASNMVRSAEKTAKRAARDEIASNEEDAKGGFQEAGNVVVRSDFRSTVFWQPDITTDAQGKAEVRVTYPDSLTGWKATARAISSKGQFGIAEATTRTKKPLIVRLQAPRFFLVGDLATVSGVINNNTDKKLTVDSSLLAEGLNISGLVVEGKPVQGQLGSVTVEPNGEKRIDWLVSVQRPGTAKLRVEAHSQDYSDAMEREYIVHEHGIEKYISKSGRVRGSEVAFNIEIPPDRKRETTTLTVQIAPSLAVTMLDALPYLIDYPYGCTEQTMSRFLPAVITAKTLREMGLKPEEVMDKVFGGIEQQYSTKTHSGGKKDMRKLDEMVKQGLARLYDFQHADGGWGWWKEDNSDRFMTAYIVWGLVLAQDAGVQLRSGVLDRAANFLDLQLVEEEINYDRQAWMLHALAAYRKANKMTEYEERAFANLWKNRDKLNSYSRALFALAAHGFGKSEQATVLARNLENGVRKDARPDTSVLVDGRPSADPSVMATAHWGETGFYWRWSDSSIEATSFALRAFMAIDPQNALIEPAVNWLVKNRRGTQWSNTRDTAIAVLALNDYLKRSGELTPGLEYELLVNNSLITSRRLTRDEVISAPSVFTIGSEVIRDGVNEVRIRCRGGSGSVYFAAQAKFFSLEEPLKAAGNEIFVKRDYYRLAGYPTLLKGYKYDRVLMRDGDTLKSGDRVEVVVTIEAKNDYDYLLFEDLKPAGMETVQVRSGEPLYAMQLKASAVERKHGELGTDKVAKRVAGGQVKRPPIPLPESPDYTGRSSYVYQELRDRKVALFISKLTQGVWEIRYTLRAEVPGSFHALPVLGQAMYVPEIRCNTDELRLRVED